MKKSGYAQLLTATLIGGWAVLSQILPRINPPPPNLSIQVQGSTLINAQQSVEALPHFDRPMPLRTAGGGTR